MSLRVAVQMDHIQTVQIEGDSTFALMLEAHKTETGQGRMEPLLTRSLKRFTEQD